MSVHVRCRCGYYMELPDEWSGKQGRCPQCHSVLNIPASAAPSVVAPSLVDDPLAERDAGVPSNDGTVHDSPLPLPLLLLNPRWLMAIGAGLSLFIAGFILVLSPSHERDGDGAAGGSGSGAAAGSGSAESIDSTVFRPAMPGTKPADPAVSAAAEPVPPAGSDPQASAAVQSASRGADRAVFDSCRLGDFGVFVPAGVASVEVDGVRMPIRKLPELVQSQPVALVLPYGKHVVRFHSGEPARVVEPKRWFLDAYREAALQVQENGQWSFDLLLDQSRRTLDRFSEPLIPHLWGNYYWQEGELDAAARHYAWALEIAPTFAPAYFNLAQLALERGDEGAARGFLRRADLWNVQNAYGIALASNALRGAMQADALEIIEDDSDWLVDESADLSDRDRDMVAVLSSAAEFAPMVRERAKILNNLGAYFEYAGNPQRALESYRSAAGVLAASVLDPDEQRVIRGILENLARVCREANMPEYRRYERLQAMFDR